MTLTHFGYVKRMRQRHLSRAEPRRHAASTALSTREEDFVGDDLHHLVRTASILFFTNKGKVFTLKGYQIPEAGRTARGTAIVNLLHARPATRRSARASRCPPSSRAEITCS